MASHSSKTIIKFADDTKIVGLITSNDEKAYREELGTLTAWCWVNNLSLSINKTMELIVDFKRNQAGYAPILINGATVEMVNNFKLLGVHISEKLKWSNHTDTVVEKARQQLFNLGVLNTLTVFYRSTIESILAGCFTAWYGNSTATGRKALQSHSVYTACLTGHQQHQMSQKGQEDHQ